MAITSYSELQSTLASWLFRTDLTDIIPSLIALCEEDINATLRVRQMEKSITLSLTSGVGTLPTDFREYREALFNGAPLEYAAPSYLGAMYSTNPAGTPQFFTVQGESFIAYPQATGSIAFSYYASVPPLNDTDTTNWLLARSPSAYLYGSLVHSAPFLGDDARTQVWGTLFDRAISQLQREDTLATHKRGAFRISSAIA